MGFTSLKDLNDGAQKALGEKFVTLREDENGVVLVAKCMVTSKAKEKTESNCYPQLGDIVDLKYCVQPISAFQFDKEVITGGKDISFTVGRERLPALIEDAIMTMRKGETAHLYLDQGKETLNSEEKSTRIFTITLEDFGPTNVSPDKGHKIICKLLKRSKQIYQPNVGAHIAIDLKVLFGESESNSSSWLEEKNLQFVVGEGVATHPLISGALELAIQKIYLGETWRVESNSPLGISEKNARALDRSHSYNQIYIVTLTKCFRAKECWELEPLEKLIESRKYKEKGLEFIKKEQYAVARTKFKAIIELLYAEGTLEGDDEKERKDLMYSAHMNSSLCSLKLEDHYAVLRSTERALALNDKSVKALYRKGLAHLSLCEVTEAKESFNKVLELDPKNVAAGRKLNFCGYAKNKINNQERRMCQRMFANY